MFSKPIVMSFLGAALALTPASRSAADIGDGIVGGLVGGAVSGIIVNESAKSRERKRAARQPRVIYKQSTRSYSPARADVREEQMALNYFGFPAGSPDGVTGRNTRNAIAQYQGYMSYPVTGQLTTYERQFLVGSFHRAQTGGAAASQIIAQRGQGTRGLLHAYRDEAAGIPTSTADLGAGTATAAAATHATTMAATAPASAVATAAAQTLPDSSTTTALPNLMGDMQGGPSLASHCSRVSLVTNSNGGFVTQASMSDPSFALSEQFCLARTYAIAEGEEMAAKVNGLTPEKMAQQCAGFGPAMKPYLTALSLQPEETVLSEVSNFILDSGMSPAQLSGTARICLSVGYRTDNMEVAIGSALLLTALGERGYAELLGHHLNEGFGTARRPDLALAWYTTAIKAAEQGSQPVFVPGDGARTDLIRKAVFRANGLDEKAMDLTQGNAAQPAAVLPSFNIAE